MLVNSKKNTKMDVINSTSLEDGKTLIQTFNSLFDFFDQIDKILLFQVIIGFVTFMFIWENYLSYRQYCVQRDNEKLPKELVNVMDQHVFAKSRIYALDKAIYSFIQGLWTQIEAYLIFYLGALPYVYNLSASQLSYFNYDSEISTSVLFSLYFMIYSTLTGLPWTIYYTFVLEEHHGFNKQTWSFFWKDNVKKLILSVVLTVPILSLLIFIIRWGGDYFFVYAWLFITIVSLLMVTIYADYIAPLFDNYVPLPPGDLRTQIEELASSLDFPLYKLYVVEGSKRSSHSNAYMYGFYKSKRIVLFDSLIEGYKPIEKIATTEATTEEVTEVKKDDEVVKGCSNLEIIAILAHELGHWKLSHNVKNLLISEVNTFFYFLIFAVLMNRQVFYSAFGFDSEKPVIIGLIIILQFIFAPYNELISFMMTQLTRRFEFQADAFAKNLGKTEHLKTGLVKLYKDNLSFPLCDWLYSTWHFSHPPLLERLRALDDNDGQKSKSE